LNSIKILNELIRFSKKESILFLFFGSIVSLGEVFLITNSKQIHNFFQNYELNTYLAIALLIFLYLIIIILGLVLVYFTKKYAFIVAHDYCYYRILSLGKINYIRNFGELNSAMTIERERLAREIIAPLFNLFIKIILPLLTITIFIVDNNLDTSFTLYFIFPLILIFIFSSNQFKKFANKLENALKELMYSIQIFVKTFDSESRFYDYHSSLKGSENDNKELAKIEGYIDSASQAPRQFIDLIIFSTVVIAYLFTNRESIVETFYLSPLLIRSISYIQAAYKSLASIRSNITALKVLSFSSNKDDRKTLIKNKISDSIKIDLNSLSIKINDKIKKINEEKIFGISYPSGYGKTNSVLNFLYPGLKLPTKIDFELIGVSNEKISFISNEPFFSPISIKATGNDSRFEIFFNEKLKPSSSLPNKSSSGELFRWNLLSAMRRNPEVLIIDESLVNVQINHRSLILDYFKNQNNNTFVIIISHSDDILKQCDIIINPI